MPHRKTAQSSGNTTVSLKLPEVVSIEAASSLRQEALSLSDTNKGCTVAIDGSHVTRMTTAGAQVLLSIQRTMAESHGEAVLHMPSDELKHTLQILGLAALIVDEQQLEAHV